MDDHLNKLKRVFIRLRDAGIQVNACKLLFCVTRAVTHCAVYGTVGLFARLETVLRSTVLRLMDLGRRSHCMAVHACIGCLEHY